MAIIKDIIADARTGLQRAPLRHLKLKDFDSMFGVHDDINAKDVKDIAEDWWRWTEEVRAENEALWRAIARITRVVLGGSVLAFQRLVVPSTASTITTASETDFAFDWTDSRRMSRVVISPGAGVWDYWVIFDKLPTSPFVHSPALHEAHQGIVYARAANTLELLVWDGSEYQSVDFDEGWTIDLAQWIPAVMSEI